MTELLFGMAHLNFDWDDILPDHQTAISAFEVLKDSFGIGRVWYRLSSSGTGLHVMIADLVPRPADPYTLDLVPKDYEDDFVLQWRNHFLQPPHSLECQGRLRADSERRSHGFRIGRIFKSKNKATSGEWKCYGLE